MQSAWNWLYDYATRWHDVWEILGAVGSFAAVVVALWFGFHENAAREATRQEELTRLEAERDEARRERNTALELEIQRERETQARQVVVHLTRLEAGNGATIARLSVFNYSAMPVFNVHAENSQDDMPSPMWSIVERLMPGEEKVFTFPEVDKGTGQYAPHNVQAFFRDATGWWWRRYGDGRLKQSSSRQV